MSGSRIWLHIGAPKSGTTALQRYLSDNRDALRAAGLSYISPGNRTSSNTMAVAINKKRQAELQEMGAEVSAEIAKADGDCVLSSEMFFGMGPAQLATVIPELTPERTAVLVYLRRQDLYIESKFVQKAKNGRFSGGIFDYIAKFDGSGADYADTLKPWQDGGYPLRLRICEPAQLVGGSVIPDAMALMNVTDAPALKTTDAVNSSPSAARLQLLQAAKEAGAPNVRRLQRMLPPDQGPKARFFTPEERQAFYAKYAASNEAIRAQYFPDQTTLFDETGLDLASDQPTYTDAELNDITAVMRALVETAK